MTLVLKWSSLRGTKVVLMGDAEDSNTCVPQDGAIGGQTNWLYKYLNTRYFRFPQDLTIQVRMLKAVGGLAALRATSGR